MLLYHHPVINLVLLFCLVSVESKNGEGDLCTHIPRCKCQASLTEPSNTTIQGRCEHAKIGDVQELENIGVTKLILRGSSHNEIHAILKHLGERNSSVKRLSIYESHLQSVNLTILPDNLEELYFKDCYIDKGVTSADCVKDNKRLHQLKTMNFHFNKYGRDGLKIQCLPDSLKSLIIWEATEIPTFAWPKSLASFKITDIKSGYPSATLAKVNPNVKVFQVRYANVDDGVMPKAYGSDIISYITVQYSNVSFVPEDTFLNHTKLKKIDLEGNHIINFDVIMPQSLQTLSLNMNLVKSCPVGLPKNLKYLILSNNRIETCSPEAFTGLTKLIQIDLGNNRLKVMPRGIESKPQVFSIRSNLLTRINGPENYEFCSDCFNIDISNNDWFCDLYFFKFLQWSIERKGKSGRVFEVFSRKGKCKNLPDYAFHSDYLNEVSIYTAYITSPLFAACRYEPQHLLNCTQANLTAFPKTPPRGLRAVRIAWNEELTTIPDYVFANQVNMKSAILRGNNFKRIPFGLPSSVIVLDLQDNNITELNAKDIEAFTNLTNLKDLILHDNHIKTLYGQNFQALKSLNWLGLEGNDLICDCSLHSFALWYSWLNRRYLRDNQLIRFARCATPLEVKDRDIRSWSLFYYYEYELKCISPLCQWNYTTLAPELVCSIESQQEGEVLALHGLQGPVYGEFPKILAKRYWKEIFLNGLRLHDEDIKITEFVNLINLDLSENLLRRWSPYMFPDSLRRLNLRGNLIDNIPEITLINKYQPNLEAVDLRDNRIKIVSSRQTATLMSLTEIYVDGNPFECNCSMNAFKLWIKFNATSANKNDAQNIKCFGPSSLSNQYLITLKEDQICQKPNVDARLWLSAGLFIVVIILSMFLILHKVKKRTYKKEILSGFLRLLQEDSSHEYALTASENSLPGLPPGENYMFDAFVATEDCAQDGDFVEKLIEELEKKRKITAYISTRDFEPGMDISESISENIRLSKRVILVLSKTFVSSPWCQYKVQIALAELHNRQKKLLIPIVLEDLSQDINSSLRTFLSLIPTFKAPDPKSSQREWDKFWNILSDAIHN